MEITPSYQIFQDGNWKLWVVPEHWSAALWTLIQARMAEQRPSKHPQTIQLELPVPEAGSGLFLKVFQRDSLAVILKDLFRHSKAIRALRQGAALSATEFNAPLAVAAGEQRRCGSLQRSFLLTRSISGEPLPVYLHKVAAAGALSLRQKRRALQLLAVELRRFHALGFVHGDLVPSNLFVSGARGSGICFYFMDNDRTAKYPSWMPQRRWRRNLVQLNRFPLPGITLQDRMRFLRQYLSKPKWDAQDRRQVFLHKL